MFRRSARFYTHLCHFCWKYRSILLIPVRKFIEEHMHTLTFLFSVRDSNIFEMSPIQCLLCFRLTPDVDTPICPTSGDLHGNLSLENGQSCFWFSVRSLSNIFMHVHMVAISQSKVFDCFDLAYESHQILGISSARASLSWVFCVVYEIHVTVILQTNAGDCQCA